MLLVKGAQLGQELLNTHPLHRRVPTEQVLVEDVIDSGNKITG